MSNRSIAGTSAGHWIIRLLAVATIGVGLLLPACGRRPKDTLCWDPPPTGVPVKYLVTFDGGTPLESPGQCVVVPSTLHKGDHVAVVRAVDKFGQVSPPASVKFVVP